MLGTGDVRGEVLPKDIAMSTGTDVAMSGAQATPVKGDLRGILCARALCSAAVANMKQNLGFAFLYNAMSLSSVSVVGNALRLARVPAPSPGVTAEPQGAT
jgi:P-type Cu+ transporter